MHSKFRLPVNSAAEHHWLQLISASIHTILLSGKIPFQESCGNVGHLDNGIWRRKCFIALQAFTNVLKRMLEAEGRGMWAPDTDTLAKLQNMYSDMDSQLEGIV